MRRREPSAHQDWTPHGALVFALCSMLCVCQFGCLDDEAPNFENFPLDGVGGPFTLWNRSQYTLQSVHVHANPYLYSEAPNLLDEPLESRAQAELRLEASDHLTVIRQRVSNGDRVALTTTRGLAFPSNHGVLVVFDDGFLVMSREEARQIEGFVDTPLPEAPDFNDIDDILVTDAGEDAAVDQPDDAQELDAAPPGDVAAPLDASPDTPLDASPDDAELDDASGEQ